MVLLLQDEGGFFIKTALALTILSVLVDAQGQHVRNTDLDQDLGSMKDHAWLSSALTGQQHVS